MKRMFLSQRVIKDKNLYISASLRKQCNSSTLVRAWFEYILINCHGTKTKGNTVADQVKDKDLKESVKAQNKFQRLLSQKRGKTIIAKLRLVESLHLIG